MLDVCCGMGGSALPGAARVAPTGSVLAVDLAQNLLDRHSRVKERRLTNIECRRGDLEALPFPDQSFDVVICVFGIFFVPDLRAAIRGLWRLIRPSGFLAITIWGAQLFEPADAKFWEAVRREDPENFEVIFKPWTKSVEPRPACAALLIECGRHGGLTIDGRAWVAPSLRNSRGLVESSLWAPDIAPRWKPLSPADPGASQERRQSRAGAPGCSEIALAKHRALSDVVSRGNW